MYKSWQMTPGLHRLDPPPCTLPQTIPQPTDQPTHSPGCQWFQLYDYLWCFCALTTLAAQGRVVRITFSTVLEESGQEHCEVTGRMPSLKTTLQAALAESGDLVQLMTEAREGLQVLSEFCNKLAVMA